MKKILVLVAAVVAFSSCAVIHPKVVTTAASEKLTQDVWVYPLSADLQVSATKISYIMSVTKAVAKGGYESAVNTAIKEALEKNGNADVLIGLQTQVKYTPEGELETIQVTGYPAKYVNFQAVKDSSTFAQLKRSSAPSTDFQVEDGGIFQIK